MESEILLTEKKGNICTLILNRPEKRNSVSLDLLIEIYQTLQELSNDDTIRTVIIRGTGDKAFSSGYDIKSIPTKATPEMQRKMEDQNPLELAMESIVNYPYPVIAMLNGYAYGAGCELAVTCDIRIGADDISMGMPPAKLGVVYRPHALQRFINVIGLPRAKEIFFTGRFYDASLLKEIGLVDYMVPRGELEPFTYGLAEEIAGNAPLSLKGTKKILNMLASSIKLSDEDLKKAEELIDGAFNSADLKEGQTAFFERRKPIFKGK